MSGKALLIVVAGFSLIFLVVGQNFGNISNRSVDNYVDYFNETVAHNIAVSGANMAANEIYLDPYWDEGYENISYQNGELDIELNIIDAYQNFREIVATGEYEGISSTVRVTLAPSNFSKFAYYSVYEGGSIWWTNKDTVWGPFHTQDYMRVYRHPGLLWKGHHKEKADLLLEQEKGQTIFLWRI